MTTLPRGDLAEDSGILRTAAQHHQVNVGVYASVLSGGEIHRGDAVSTLQIGKRQAVSDAHDPLLPLWMQGSQRRVVGIRMQIRG
jgi:MOSC domain-containing protein YiiM